MPPDAANRSADFRPLPRLECELWYGGRTLAGIGTQRHAEVLPRALAAASHLDAPLVAWAVTVPVALVRVWAYLVTEVQASLVPAYSPSALAPWTVAADGGFEWTPPVIDGWYALAWSPLRPGNTRSQ